MGKKITFAAGESISLFAQEQGVKVLAAQGPVVLQAQHNEMHLTAHNDMTLTSQGGKTVIAAKEELLLTCGGAFIRLKGGEITYGSPGNQIVKAPNWMMASAESMNVSHPEFPTSLPKQHLRFQLNSSPLSPLKNRAHEPYRLYAQGALIAEGISDEEGNIMIEHEVTTEKYQLHLLNGDSFDIDVAASSAKEEEELIDTASVGFRPSSPSDIKEGTRVGRQWGDNLNQFMTLLNRRK